VEFRRVEEMRLPSCDEAFCGVASKECVAL